MGGAWVRVVGGWCMGEGYGWVVHGVGYGWVVHE